MPVPANRTPVRVARGNVADLQANLAALQEGEVCYGLDTHTLYVVEMVGGAKTLRASSGGGGLRSGNGVSADPVSQLITGIDEGSY